MFVRKLFTRKTKGGIAEVDEVTNGFEQKSGSKITKCQQLPINILEAAAANFHQNSTSIISRIEDLQHKLENIDEKRNLLESWKTQFSASINIGSVVSVNVGGKVVNVRKELIGTHECEENLFALLSGKYDHLFPKDRNSRVFLDLDHHWVNPIINLARDMTMWDGVEEKSRPRLSCDTLCLSGMSVMGHDTSSLRELWMTTGTDSEILKSLKTVNFIEILSGWLEDKNKQMSLNLLFRGSRDGFTAEAFHDKCDNHKDTISIIRDTDDSVFGGYVDKEWKSTSSYCAVPSDKAFLFSLKRSGTETAKQYSIVKSKNYAMYNDSRSMCVFGGGRDLLVTDSCNMNSNSRSNKGSYDLEDNSLTKGTNFTVAEIEVFQIIFHESPSIIQSVVPKDHSRPFLDANVSLYGDYFQESLNLVNQMMSELKQHQQLVITAEDKLLSEAIAFREELKFVAKFAAVDLPSAEKNSKGKKRELETFESVLHEIETIVKILVDYRVDSNTDVNSIVYINVAECDVIAVSKTTLLQAPSGSILANMASNAWGHDLDSEGNIIQDVNPELFRLIIAHLRLRTLLQREDRMSEVPPISVYADQKAAMENLLAFYAMSEVPLQVLLRSAGLKK